MSSKIPFDFNASKVNSLPKVGFLNSISRFRSRAFRDVVPNVYRDFLEALSNYDNDKIHKICESQFAKKTTKALDTFRRSGFSTEFFIPEKQETFVEIEEKTAYYGLFLDKDFNLPDSHYVLRSNKNEKVYVVKEIYREESFGKKFQESLEKKIMMNDTPLSVLLENYGETSLENLLKQRPRQRYEEVLVKLYTGAKLELQNTQPSRSGDPAKPPKEKEERDELELEVHSMRIGKLLHGSSSGKSKYFVIDFDDFMEGNRI